MRARELTGPNAVDVRFTIRDRGPDEPLLYDGIGLACIPDASPMIRRRPAGRPQECAPRAVVVGIPDETRNARSRLHNVVTHQPGRFPRLCHWPSERAPTCLRVPQFGISQSRLCQSGSHGSHTEINRFRIFGVTIAMKGGDFCIGVRSTRKRQPFLQPLLRVALHRRINRWEQDFVWVCAPPRRANVANTPAVCRVLYDSVHVLSQREQLCLGSSPEIRDRRLIPGFVVLNHSAITLHELSGEGIEVRYLRWRITSSGGRRFARPCGTRRSPRRHIAKGEHEVRHAIGGRCGYRSVELGPVEGPSRTLNFGPRRHIPKPKRSKRERRKRRDAGGWSPVACSKIVYVHTKIGSGDRSSGRLSL